MLSTSILYCNKLDDELLETIDSASAVNAGFKSKKSPLLTVTSKSGGPATLNPSAISGTFSEASTSGLSGGQSRSRFRVRYLGCNTCDPRTHRLDNGIAAYQKPLLDLYGTVLRRSVVLRSLYSSIATINQVADLSTHGIVIAERDRFSSSKSAQLPQPTRPNSSVSNQSSAPKMSADTVVTKVITPLSNILLWAAVKFQHRSNVKKSKGSPVKRRQIGVAFVPLSCSEAVLDKNAFVSLSSKQRFLLGLPHPPLFACVLQKVNSGQRLECHLFVCLSSDDAIRMCNQMAELRTSNIGRLHVPLPGQMGSYSYKSTPLQSSAASMVSNRSSSYAFSELSSFIAKHHFSANSDIEEEDHARMPIDDQMDSLNTNTTSAVKGIAIFGKQLTPQLLNGKLSRDQRFFERTRKTGPAKHLSPVGTDSMSWTELSSISSALISTKSESNKSCTGSHVAAQRDYRFQAYKCPQNYVLPEIIKQNDDRKSTCHSSIDTNKKIPVEVKVTEKVNVNLRDSGNNKWTSVSDELQSNKLFAKASAIASLQSREATPSYDRDSKLRIQNSKAIRELSVATENSRPNSTQRFFGDTIRGPKTAPKPEVTKSHLKAVNKPVNYQVKPISKDYRAKSDEDSAIAARKVDQYNFQPSSSHRTNEGRSFSNGNLQTTISNSIFFDEEESSQSNQEPQFNGDQNAVKCYSPKIYVANDNTSKTKNEHNRTVAEHSPRSPYKRDKHRMEKTTSKGDAPVVLYLPTQDISLPSNVGVKCFNKSTPVDKWSTMISSNVSNNNSLRENECELCSLELNCEECCNLCQSIEQQQRQSCPDCMLDGDDIVLDESIMQNFTKNQLITDDGKQSGDLSGSAGQNGNLYRYEIQMANMPRLEVKISKSQSRKQSLLGRIRQLGSSIFGSRSRTLNRSRIWSRLRTGSQKLKGSKRFTSKSASSSPSSKPEPVNRIFLPAPNETRPNGDCRVYAEQYLKPPPATKGHSGRQNARKDKTTPGEVQQLGAAMNRVELGSDRRSREKSKSKEPRNGDEVSQPKVTNKAENSVFKEVHKRTNVNERSAENVKPFFISHPSKAFSQNGLQVSHSEFNPGQVLSISSDSGMEEYDCHSSTENSPLDYQGGNSHLKSGKAFERERSKSKVPPAKGGMSQRETQPTTTTDWCGQSRVANSKSNFMHQACHSVALMNLQTELGYMP